MLNEEIVVLQMVCINDLMNAQADLRVGASEFIYFDATNEVWPASGRKYNNGSKLNCVQKKE